MDIQKEKRAIKNLKAFYMEDWNLTEEERDDFDNLVSRIVAVIKAEAQAPEGFVLVSKEISLSALKEGLQYLPADCLSIDLEKAYLAIVKAQEQGHDSM